MKMETLCVLREVMGKYTKQLKWFKVELLVDSEAPDGENKRFYIDPNYNVDDDSETPAPLRWTISENEVLTNEFKPLDEHCIFTREMFNIVERGDQKRFNKVVKAVQKFNSVRGALILDALHDAYVDAEH